MKKLLFILALALPLMAAAQATTTVPNSFGSNGVYGCEGATNNSIGMEIAGGVFVPVSERAVSHNTNILVYKACVLDAIAARMREAALAFLVKSTLSHIARGYDGATAFVTNLGDTRLQVGDQAMQQFTEGLGTDNICTPFKQDVREALARTYLQSTRQPQDTYTCSIDDQTYGAYTNSSTPLTWSSYIQAIQPQNTPFGAYYLALQQMTDTVDQAISDQYTELGWGNGYKSQKTCRQVPVGNGLYEQVCDITTPGSTIANMVNSISDTGRSALVNAHSIDELVGSLMTNMQTQILTSTGGLAGINSSGGGLASYLEQLASDAAARTRDQYTDAGTGYLAGAIAVETAYKTARTASQSTLTGAGDQYKVKEQTCWDGLVAQAKTDLLAQAQQDACNRLGQGNFGGGTQNNCTITGNVNVTYSAATSSETYDITITANAGGVEKTATLHHTTSHSYDAIARNVSPLLRVINDAVRSADQALAVLVSIQANLAGANTPSNTQYVLQQLNQLAASGTLHSAGDVVDAQSQNQQISDTMSQEYQATADAWDAGWCKPSNWPDQKR